MTTVVVQYGLYRGTCRWNRRNVTAAEKFFTSISELMSEKEGTQAA